VNEMWRTTHGDVVSVFTRGRLRTRWHWHVQSSRNWEIVEQGEGYSRRIDCVTAALRHHPRVEDES
jgi:hypothetical protein